MGNAGLDVIVIGAGALGAATAFRLAAQGRSVLVCEQFTPGHSLGSSNDHSRIIRHAYHSPAYTALTPAAYEAWADVEARCGEQLVVRTGGIDLAEHGTPGHDVLDLYATSMAVGGIDFERLTAADVRRRWPQWSIGDATTGLFQADGGLVDIGKATAAHLRLALAAGAELAHASTVVDVAPDGEGVTVTIRTAAGTLEVRRAEHVIVCAGSWAGTLFDALNVPIALELSQEQVQYFAAADLASFAPQRFPIWIWHGEHDFYGFPVYGQPAVKAARDMTGRIVTQQTRSFQPDPDESEFVARFLAERLPGAVGPVHLAKTCIYDLPRDRELVIGALPGQPRILTAIGAGHAGKFAALIGEVLADLAVKGETRHPIDAFRADRATLSGDAPTNYRLGRREHARGTAHPTGTATPGPFEPGAFEPGAFEEKR